MIYSHSHASVSPRVLVILLAGGFFLGVTRAEDQPTAKTADLAALKAEVERLRGMVPDQSHAMKDVAYHFTNLWFAGDKQNWPLAEFYLSETRAHLRWAVRIIPVRKTPQGQELRLAEVLDPLDKSVFQELQETLKAKDALRFRTKYEQV